MSCLGLRQWFSCSTGKGGLMITLQKWRVISLVVLGISAVLVLDNPPAIAESPFHPQCSLQSVRGTYGVFFVVSSDQGQQTLSGVGVITADGKGHFVSGTETFNTGSQVCTNVELSGTYTVNANCTGTTSVTFTGQTEGCSGSLTQSMVIFGKGNLIKLISTAPGVVTLTEEWQRLGN